MQAITHFIDSFTPNHYDLSLTLQRTERLFHGTVTINGSVTHDQTNIFLHAKDLSIEQVVFDGKQIQYTTEGDTLELHTLDALEGKHTVTIVFSGKINDQMHGLYPCYYEHDGRKKELLATQFESHHAREVFPCVDEPAAKATFDVTLTTEKDVTVLGNMPVATQRVEHDQLVTKFDRTPSMSTYLLAWVVGEMHKVSAKTKDDVEVSIWATPAQPAESLTFALDIATRTIDFFNEYFGVPYPLPKSDNVALPDFSSGAMENWGLITYREVALLADPKTASLDNKQQAALVIAHELSHQWFGNLVTMQWWNDLWLNESFANMMEYIAIDAIEPTWNVWLDHAGHEVVQALRRDSLDGVQPIQVEVHDPEEINALFDPAIVYAKGGRLLRMLQTYIGDTAMRQGLQSYFKKFAYQNTVADDLWSCFSEVSGLDIAALMSRWIEQSGYPVVHVTRQGKEYSLQQEQFFIGEHTASNKLWPIPLGSGDESVTRLMDDSNITIDTKDGTVPLINQNSSAHFVTHYSDELFAEVLQNLRSMTEIDRLKILNEHILLARGGIVSNAALVPLLQQFADETSEAVWGVIAMTIAELKKFVEDDEPAETALKQLVGSLAKKQYDRLGWIERLTDSDTDRKLRGTILSLTLYSEEPRAVQQALELYHAAPFDTLDPNLRVTLAAAAVQHTEGHTIVDELINVYTSSTSSEIREDIAAALTSTKDTTVIQRYLEMFKDKTMIRPQDLTRWFVWTLANRHGRALTWQWLQDNWQWLEQVFSGDKSYDGYPRYVATILTTPEQRDEYIAFFSPLKEQVALRRNITVGITEVSHRVALIGTDGPFVRKALLNL